MLHRFFLNKTCQAALFASIREVYITNIQQKFCSVLITTAFTPCRQNYDIKPPHACSTICSSAAHIPKYLWAQNLNHYKSYLNWDTLSHHCLPHVAFFYSKAPYCWNTFHVCFKIPTLRGRVFIWKTSKDLQIWLIQWKVLQTQRRVTAHSPWQQYELHFIPSQISLLPHSNGNWSVSNGVRKIKIHLKRQGSVSNSLFVFLVNTVPEKFYSSQMKLNIF